MKKRAAAMIIVVIAIIVVLGIFWYRGTDMRKVGNGVTATSIFSWEAEYMEPEMEEDVAHAMENLACGAIYQEVPEDTDEKVVIDYLRRRSEAAQDVYYLTGEREWGLAEKLDLLLEEIETVKEWNAKAGRGQGFRGIVLDVEPYLLECWDDDREEYMKQYVDSMTAAYESAKEAGLWVIVCIPNFYDRLKLDEQMERLVAEACDGIAIMNYNKNDESGQILTEVMLAEKHKKAVLNIVEMQKPGYHELTEENTYYDDGFEAVYESWERIRENYPYEGLGFSWHYLKPIIKLMEDGELE